MIKRLLFTIFLALSALTIISAQRAIDFSQRGAASQEMTADGLVGAHPSLPINSKVTIINPSNNREVEITIIGRISASMNRIIDLSPAAVSALGMRAGDQIILSVTAPPRPESLANRQTGQIVDVEPRLVAGTPPATVAQSPITAAQNPVVQEPPVASTSTNEQNYNRMGQMLSTEEMFRNLANPGVSVEFLAWLMAMTFMDREAREVREAREIREFREMQRQRE